MMMTRYLIWSRVRTLRAKLSRPSGCNATRTSKGVARMRADVGRRGVQESLRGSC